MTPEAQDKIRVRALLELDCESTDDAFLLHPAELLGIIAEETGAPCPAVLHLYGETNPCTLTAEHSGRHVSDAFDPPVQWGDTWEGEQVA